MKQENTLACFQRIHQGEKMTTVFEFRRRNLQVLISNSGGPLALATKLGYSNSSFLVQMAGPSPIRDVTERTARSYELKLGLEPMSLDKAVDMLPEDVATYASIRPRRQLLPESMGAEAFVKLVQLIVVICEREAVNLPLAKLPGIVELALCDASSNHNTLREDHIRQLVLLTK